MSQIIFILIITCFPREILCNLTHYSSSNLINFVFYTSICLLIACLIKLLLQNIKIKIDKLLLFAIGVLIGLASKYLSFVKEITQQVQYIDIQLLIHLTITPIIFKTVFQTDGRLLRANICELLSQILLCYLSITFIESLIVFKCFDNYFALEVSLIFGLLTAMTKVQDVVTDFKRNGQEKLLTLFMETESIVTTLTSIFLFEYLILFHNGKNYEGWTIFAILFFFLSYIFGHVLGVITSGLLNFTKNNPAYTFIILFSTEYIVFYVIELLGSGIVGLVAFTLKISSDKTKFPDDSLNLLIKHWTVLEQMVTSCIYIMIGQLIFLNGYWKLSGSDIPQIVVCYLAKFSVRTCVMFSVYFIFKKLNRTTSLNAKEVLTLVYTGTPSVISFMLAYSFYGNQVLSSVDVRSLMLTMTFYHVFMQEVLNSTSISYLVRSLGLTRLSLAKLDIINNALNVTLKARDRKMNSMKQNNLYVDVNWPLVTQQTQVFNFNKNRSMKINVEQLNDEELIEFLDEIMLKMLKTRLISYWRQYEQETLSQSSLRVLINILEKAEEGKIKKINLEEFNLMFKSVEKWLKLRQWLIVHNCKRLKSEQESIRPRYTSRLKHNCRKILNNVWLTVSSILLTLVLVVVLVYDLAEILIPPDYETPFTIPILQTLLFLYFSLEYLIKCIVYCDLRLHFFCSYFHSFHTVCILLQTANMCLVWAWTDANLGISITLKCMGFLQSVMILENVKNLIPKIHSKIENMIDSELTLIYDAGLGFVCGENEVLKYLPSLIQEEKLLDKLRKEIHEGRLEILKLLAKIEMIRTNVTTEVKTKQVIQTILHQMLETSHRLKVNGLLDNIEHDNITEILNDKLNFIKHNTKLFKRTSNMLLLSLVPWLYENVEEQKRLERRLHSFTLSEKSILIKEGTQPICIYIVVSGLLKIIYRPDPDKTRRQKAIGALPNIDLFTNIDTTHSKEHIEYLSRGSVIGELGLLTNREYDSTIECETIVQLSTIRNSDVTDHSIIYKMWKCVCVHVAVVLLSKMSTFHGWSNDQIKYYLQTSYIPDVRHLRLFSIDETMKDVILIEGVVKSSAQVHVAPSYISRDTSFLELMDSDSDEWFGVEPKLLIVPFDEDEYITHD